jgi:16S rRNA (cytidine1402-2'-O)-methyltransferase
LELLEQVFGGYIRVFVARELTKIHETAYRGRIRQVRNLLEKEIIKGECVVVVEI